jgi:hypothetical protein
MPTRFEYDAEENREKYRETLRAYESREQAIIMIVASYQLGLETAEGEPVQTAQNAIDQIAELLGAPTDVHPEQQEFAVADPELINREQMLAHGTE